MSVVEEIRAVVKLVADMVDETRAILEAINDGAAYLRKYHPAAKPDLAELLEQMRVTVAGLISVSRVVTDFDFTVDGSALDREPARFNEHRLSAGRQAAALEENIRLLKGSCTRVHHLTEALNKRAGNRPWWALLGDRGGARAAELAGTMHRLYGVDQDIIRHIERMLRVSETALRDVRKALRRGSGSSVGQVQVAARTLHQHAEEFRPLETRLKQLRNELGDLIAAFD
jgi:hypothetical protein